MSRDPNTVSRSLGEELKVIVIAPAPISRTVKLLLESGCDKPVEIFESIEAFENARTGQDTIPCDVLDALLEIDVQLTTMSGPLRQVFLALLNMTATPRVEQLAKRAGSSRSLYRWWEDMPEPPAAFLRRVRRLHAKRLREGGLSAKEAAYAAGYSSQSLLSKAGGGSDRKWRE